MLFGNVVVLWRGAWFVGSAFGVQGVCWVKLLNLHTAFSMLTLISDVAFKNYKKNLFFRCNTFVFKLIVLIIIGIGKKLIFM